MSFTGKDHLDKAETCLRNARKSLNSLLRADEEDDAQFAWESFLDQVVKVHRFVLQSADRVLTGYEKGCLVKRIRENKEFQYALHARNCLGHNTDIVARNAQEVEIDAMGAPNAIRVPTSVNVIISSCSIGAGYVHTFQNQAGSANPYVSGIKKVSIEIVEKFCLLEALDSGRKYSVPTSERGEPLGPEALAHKVIVLFESEIARIKYVATKKGKEQA